MEVTQEPQRGAVIVPVGAGTVTLCEMHRLVFVIWSKRGG